MGTYTPLDLNALYNAGLDILGGQGPPRRTMLSRLAFCAWQRCWALSNRLWWGAIRCGNYGRSAGDLDDCGASACWSRGSPTTGRWRWRLAEYALHYEDGEVLQGASARSL